MGGSTRIQGILHSSPSTTFDMDFYANPACSNFPREFLEGETYIGSSQVTTDGSGKFEFDVTLPVALEAGARVTATATDPAGNTSEFSQRIIFSISPTSGRRTGGAAIAVSGTDFADPTTLTFGGAAAVVTFANDQSLTTTSPALAPGTVNDVVATTAEGLTGVLVKGWVSDFLDVPEGQQFHSFVTTLVSNAITVGVGGGIYGVDQETLRQQMAVFLLKAKHGLCFVPPPCTAQVFDDVPCSLVFAPWINELVAEGHHRRLRAAATPTARRARSSASRWPSCCCGPCGAPATRLPPARSRPSPTSRARATSPRGSTTSSPAASPPAAAAASTAPPRPPTAGRWPRFW